ncbi:oncoprotein-induced transcript 3 protein-like [Watersipora subatra]|uniref:oncoprotein-induced transcript 3 protein-like n=1 Tax=Watersipora subatra TaxID=2589382 RepID=UPI00355C1272
MKTSVFLSCIFLVSSLIFANSKRTDLSDSYQQYDENLKNELIQSKSEAETEYLFYQARIRVLHKLMQKECQPADLKVLKREVVGGVSSARLDTENIVYEQMVRMLDDCRARKSLSQSSTPATTTQSQTPSECDLAVNLTEARRQDHNGSRIWPNGSPACDWPALSAKWFRFTGEAGSKMLDSCPAAYSCGSHIGMWSDDNMPTEIGKSMSAKAYISWNSNCRNGYYPMTVIRCSYKTPNDFIYRIEQSFGCSLAFCGMD